MFIYHFQYLYNLIQILTEQHVYFSEKSLLFLIVFTTAILINSFILLIFLSDIPLHQMLRNYIFSEKNSTFS